MLGRNPYVARAHAAEEKASLATDDLARVLAHREAAREWDRASAREASDRRRREYEDNAARQRALADAVGAGAPAASPVEEVVHEAPLDAVLPAPSRLLN